MTCPDGVFGTYTVADEEPEGGDTVVEVLQQVAGLLGGPGRAGWLVTPRTCR